MPEDPNRDMAVLGDLISKLQVAYEQYFTGGAKREPLDLVRQAESIIHTYAVSQIQSPVVRFRFNSLMARYNSFKNVWERRKRIMEGAQPAKSWGLKTAKKEAEEKDVHAFVIPEGPLREPQVAEIFERYLEIRNRCGEPSDKIRPENFKAVLGEHVRRLRERTGIQAVLVKVDVHEKRSRISAKPLE